MAKRDSYRWPWMRAQYEMGGLSFRQIAALHESEFGVRVSVGALSKRANAESWARGSKVNKVNSEAANLKLVPGGASQSEQSERAYAREIAERQVAVLEKHQKLIGDLYGQVERMSAWSTEIFVEIESQRKLQRLLSNPDAIPDARSRHGEMAMTLRIMGALRANTVELSRAIGTLIPLEREAHAIGIKDAPIDEHGDSFDIAAIRAANKALDLQCV